MKTGHLPDLILIPSYTERGVSPAPHLGVQVLDIYWDAGHFYA